MKVADFGCARKISNIESNQRVPGCIPYLSPERIESGVATEAGV